MGRHLSYRYEMATPLTPIDDPDLNDSTGSNLDGNLEESQFSWNEDCQYIDGEREVLWTTETGVTTFNYGGKQSVAILGNTSSLRQLQLPGNSPLKLPDEMQWVYSVLKGVRLLGKRPVRPNSKRREPLLRVSRKGSPSYLYGIADLLAYRILRHWGTEEFDEFESVCQRVGIGSKIAVQKFVQSGGPRETTEGEDEEYASVLLDGVNVGLLSDGTLRVLSILAELVFSSHDSSITTIIEEPETQIHPGMLAKLLNEIETYMFGENLILSTHSPQVVAWTKPGKINLVARNNGRTIVRKLGEDEIHNVVEYLCEEGNLGEWIYSGILDD